MPKLRPVSLLSELLALLCCLTLSGSSLVFGVFLLVHMLQRTQLYIYLTVLMPSGEAVSLIVMLFCAFLTGAVAAARLYKGRLSPLPCLDAVMKLALALFLVLTVPEVKLFIVCPILSGIYLAAAAAGLISKTSQKRKLKVYYDPLEEADED